MKKIITFLFSLGIVAVSFAQYDGGVDRNNNYAYVHDGQFHHDGIYQARDYDFQMQKINNDFQNRINSIMNDPYMRGYEKREAVREARFEKDRQIQFLNDKFRSYRHDGEWRHYDRDNRSGNW